MTEPKNPFEEAEIYMINKDADFEDADYYTCRKREDEDGLTLVWQDPESAIQEEIGYDASAGVDVTVYAFRQRPHGRWLAEQAIRLLQEFIGEYWSHYGLEGRAPIVDAENSKGAFDCLKAFADEHLEPYYCDQVGTRTYSADEVRAIIEDGLYERAGDGE